MGYTNWPLLIVVALICSVQIRCDSTLYDDLRKTIPPTLETSPVTEITYGGGVAGGLVTDDGNATISVSFCGMNFTEDLYNQKFVADGNLTCN
ncbi:MAG: hypothetical protein IIA45_15660 [Bacteroidetes bacterium]|nr:hypothetical protein [Bacteroidota bacterium]